MLNQSADARGGRGNSHPNCCYCHCFYQWIQSCIYCIEKINKYRNKHSVDLQFNRINNALQRCKLCHRICCVSMNWAWKTELVVRSGVWIRKHTFITSLLFLFPFPTQADCNSGGLSPQSTGYSLTPATSCFSKSIYPSHSNAWRASEEKETIVFSKGSTAIHQEQLQEVPGSFISKQPMNMQLNKQPSK